MRRGALAALCAPLLVLLAPASGAAPQQPTPVPVSADGFAADVPGSHATEVEPSAAASGSTIVAAFQVGRIFGGGAAAIGYATSTDAGATWRSGLLPGLTRFGPSPGTADAASDPVVAYDALHGRWLVAALTLAPAEHTLVVSSSADGLAWSPPVQLATTAPGTIDKDWLTCDDWPASPERGRCYAAYATWPSPDSRTARIAVQASGDAGASWSPQALITPIDFDPSAADVLGAEPVVRPSGELVVAFDERGTLKAVRSTDGGTTFGARETVAAIATHRSRLSGNALRTTVIPTIAADAAGTVYLAWQDCRFRPSCAANDVVVSRSSAPGSWTPPERIPLEPVGSDVGDVIPGLAVDGSGSRLALAFYRLSPGGLSAGLALSTDGGRTWRAEQVGAPMALEWLAPTRAGRMVGDYVAAVLVPGKAVGIVALARQPEGGALDEAISAAALPLLEPPRNLRPPAVVGAAQLGRRLSCRPGAWAGSRPLRYAYRWLRNGRLVAGAVTARYRVRPLDVGARLACRIVAANAAGSAQAASSSVLARRRA